MMNKDLSSGLGVVNLETSTMIGGFTGKQGSGGPHDSMAGYIAPVEQVVIPNNGDYTFSPGNDGGPGSPSSGSEDPHRRRPRLPQADAGRRRQPEVAAPPRDSAHDAPTTAADQHFHRRRPRMPLADAGCRRRPMWQPHPRVSVMPPASSDARHATGRGTRTDPVSLKHCSRLSQPREKGGILNT